MLDNLSSDQCSEMITQNPCVIDVLARSTEPLIRFLTGIYSYDKDVFLQGTYNCPLMSMPPHSKKKKAGVCAHAFAKRLPVCVWEIGRLGAGFCAVDSVWSVRFRFRWHDRWFECSSRQITAGIPSWLMPTPPWTIYSEIPFISPAPCRVDQTRIG